MKKATTIAENKITCNTKGKKKIELRYKQAKLYYSSKIYFLHQ